MKIQKKFLIYLFLLALALTVLPHVIRFSIGNETIPGYEPYYHLRLSERIMNGDFRQTDDLIQGGREAFFNPYHVLLSIFGFIFGLKIASLILPVLIGLTSVYIFFKILGHFKLEKNSIFLMCMVLILSPQFIFTYSTSNSHSASIFLILLGVFFFLKKERLYLFLSVLCFASLTFFGLFNLLIALFLLLAYSLAEEKKQKWFLAVLFITLLIYFIHPTGFFHSFNQQISSNILREAVSDFGGVFGFGIFNIVLFFIGFFFSWHRKKEEYPLYIIMCLLLIASFFFGSSIYLYLNFIVACFGGYALFRIIKLQWNSQLIRNLTILLIICGLLFSSVSYINRLSNLGPDEDTVKALEWMRYNSEKGVVFSHITRGYWIEEIADRPVLLDGMFKETKRFNNKISDAESVFHSVYLDDSKEILDKYNVKYIFVDVEMKNGLIWKDRDGLLFLLQDNETFKNIYNQYGIEVWEVINFE